MHSIAHALNIDVNTLTDRAEPSEIDWSLNVPSSKFITALRPEYSVITNSINAAIMLAQIIYWQNKMGNKYWYKTAQEWKEELGFSSSMVRTAQKKLIELKLIKTKTESRLNKTYYKLSHQTLYKLLSNLPEQNIKRQLNKKESTGIYKKIDALTSGIVIAIQQDFLLKLNPTAATLLTQIYYWQNKKGAKIAWPKTDNEWIYELNLTRRKLEAARKMLLKSGLIYIEKRGAPSIHYYCLNEENLSIMFNLNLKPNQTYTSYDNEELEQFKKINLPAYLINLGYQETQKSTSKDIVLRKGNQTLLITEKDSIWVYWDTTDDSNKGSIIDFVMHYHNCNLGDARKILNDYSGNHPENTAVLKDISHVDTNPTHTKLVPVTTHPYLLNRKITEEIQKIYDGQLFKTSDKYENLAVHYVNDKFEKTGTSQRNVDFKQNSKGSSRNWVVLTNPMASVTIICESVIDGLSYLALHPDLKVNIVSCEGNLTSNQLKQVKPLLLKLPGMEKLNSAGNPPVLIATDNDENGEAYRHKLLNIFSTATIARPTCKDWNDDLKEFLDVISEEVRPQESTTSKAHANRLPIKNIDNDINVPISNNIEAYNRNKITTIYEALAATSYIGYDSAIHWPKYANDVKFRQKQFELINNHAGKSLNNAVHAYINEYENKRKNLRKFEYHRAIADANKLLTKLAEENIVSVDEAHPKLEASIKQVYD